MQHKADFQVFFTIWNLMITDSTSRWNIISPNIISKGSRLFNEGSIKNKGEIFIYME